MVIRFVLICALILTGGAALDPNIAQTKNGPVRGQLRGNYYAFEGLRYAAPPVGKERFQPPNKYTEKWKDAKDSTKVGSVCLQWNPLAPGNVVGEEDCLFLNVYKPAKNSSSKFPVIVHIHGGAFQYGDGSFYGPKLIMSKENFVYVNFNYRLGILGFLSTESDDVPGNMGFKDQVMALKWVKDNIDGFQGDAKSVTLTGFEAGGASVHLHYMSPMSVGLFRRGISHSGTATAKWVLTSNPAQKAKTVAKYVNCPTTNLRVMVNCMRTKAATDLVKANPQFNEMIGPTFAHPIFTFTGVVERGNKDVFIRNTPTAYIKGGRIRKLPWLTSVTKDEGLFPTADLYSDQTIKKINSDWKRYLPLLLDYNTTSQAQRDAMTNNIKLKYFSNDTLSKKNFDQLTKLHSQRYYFCAIKESIQLQSKITPVYSYFFEFKLKSGFGEYFSKSKENLGICHGEDILLIYSTPLNAAPYVYSDEEKLMTEKLLEMYATFAKTEVPKFNNENLSRPKQSVQFTVISGPKKVAQSVAKPICDADWNNFATVPKGKTTKKNKKNK